jgi:hypothetical protein
VAVFNRPLTAEEVRTIYNGKGGVAGIRQKQR